MSISPQLGLVKVWQIHADLLTKANSHFLYGFNISFSYLKNIVRVMFRFFVSNYTPLACYYVSHVITQYNRTNVKRFGHFHIGLNSYGGVH